MKAIVFVSTVENPEEPMTVSGTSLNTVTDHEIPNDFDLIAVEAAVQQKEAGHLDEVIVFGMGTELTHLQKCLAMGADRAVFVPCSRADITADDVISTALEAFRHMDMTEILWMLGKLDVNFEGHQMAQRLATALGIPCLGSVHHIQKQGNIWHVTCESENGTPIFQVQAPFVITADLRLASPRFPSLPNIIRSRKKPVTEIAPVIATTKTTLKTIKLEPAHHGQRACQFIDKKHALEAILGSHA